MRFEYLDAYRSLEAPTPLSISMPPRIGSFGHAVVHPFLQGLLPDNDKVLTRWGKQFQVSPSSPFALLGTPVGWDCAGAVQFRRPDVEPDAVTGIDWIDEAEIARRIKELKADQAAWTPRMETGQFSLAGAQAKMALRREGDRWGMPSGDEPTTHILKPALLGVEAQGVNEHLCLAAARAVGLHAAGSVVERFEGEAALVVERYDRIALGGQLIRIHQEDLCQALGVPPELKYQREGGPSPRQIAALLRSAVQARDADAVVWRFADALAWNWLIAGTDAHAKNYSLLLAGRLVQLAPLYDMASLLPYGDLERKMRLAMKIGGKYDVYLADNTWRRAAVDLGLPGDELEARVVELATYAPDAFSTAAVTADGLGTDMPARLTDLVADRCARCTELIKTTAPL